MKIRKNILKIFSIFLIIAMLFSFLTFVYADEEDYEDELEVEDQTTITYVPSSEEFKYSDSDLFIFEDVIKIDYPVSGNVFAMGKDVTIESSVDGNVFVLTNSLKITSDAYITNDLFVAAKDVSISGYLSNLYCVTGTFTLGEGGYITRDVYCSAGEVNLAGYIRRNAYISSDSINISNPVQAIGGKLDYYANSEANFRPTSVSGEITYHKTESSGSSFKDFLSNLIQSLAYSVVIILIFLLLEKKLPKKSSEESKFEIKKIALKGLLGLICVPICIFILLVTVIGVPIAFALLALYCLAISLTTALVALGITRWAMPKYQIPNTFGKKLLVGSCAVLAILLLSSIPYIGWIISLAQTLIGFGIIVNWILPYFCSTKKAEKDNAIKEEKAKEIDEVDEKKEEKGEDKKSTKKDKSDK